MIQTILVAEDDPGLRAFLKKSLVTEGYAVVEAEDGISALALFEKKFPDLVILDLGLPKLSGESVCREIKKNSPYTPVIILTAKSKSADVVAGFNVGADHYVTKPFVLDELLARINARLDGSSEETLQVADLILDNTAKEVTRAGKKIKFTPKEFALLRYLMGNKGRVLSREVILNKVWSYSPEIESRAVDVYVGYLRRKIDKGRTKKLIHSVRGFGYVIKE